MNDNEFWVKFWKLVLIFLVNLVWAAAAYNITDRLGPLRPARTDRYEWPSGTPSR